MIAGISFAVSQYFAIITSTERRCERPTNHRERDDAARLFSYSTSFSDVR